MSRQELLDAATMAWALAAMLRIQARALDDELNTAERRADELNTALFDREGS